MKQYFLDDDEDTLFSFDDLCDEIFSMYNSYYEDYYVDDDIDECYDSVTIAGQTFYAHEVLERCDEDLYRDVREEFIESAIENDREYYADQIENMENGDIENICGFDVHCVEDSEDEEDDDVVETVRQPPVQPIGQAEPTQEAVLPADVYIFTDADLNELNDLI